MDVSFGRTASYGPQRVLMALSFILIDNVNFWRWGGSRVLLWFTGDINLLAILAILFHFCGLREGENLRTLAAYVHKEFSVTNLLPSLEY